MHHVATSEEFFCTTYGTWDVDSTKERTIVKQEMAAVLAFLLHIISCYAYCLVSYGSTLESPQYDRKDEI